jgi:hypothetical protein
VSTPDSADGLSKAGIRLLVPISEEINRTESTPWLVEGLLPSGVVTAISGAPLAGKTSFAFHLAEAVGLGTEFAGHKVVGGPHRVAWISSEDGWAAEMSQRGDTDWPWLMAVPQEVSQLFMVTDGSPDTFTQQWRELTEVMKEQGDYGLLVVDHLLGFATTRSGKGIDRPEAVGPFLAALGQLARETGCAVILLHHTGKTGKPMGSTNISARVRAEITLSRRERDGHVVARVKSNRLTPFALHFSVMKPHQYELTTTDTGRKGIVEAPKVAPAQTTPRKGQKARRGRSRASKGQRRDSWDSLATDAAAAPSGLSQRDLAGWLKANKGYQASVETIRARLRALNP